MSRPATDRLKVNPPLGSLPVLQYCAPAQLKIDVAYQRSLEAAPSQALIRRIAMFWDWDLCQPLVVSRRADGEMYVVDGQHRKAGAELRGDIAQLPCVISTYSTAADEAASFVALNQQRRALGALDLFKAALAASDAEATAVMAAIERAGLSLAPHSNWTAWKPGMVSNISGIRTAYRLHGPAAAELALRTFAEAFRGQILRYAGTIFMPLARICAGHTIDSAQMVRVLSRRSQKEWISEFHLERASSNIASVAAGEKVLRAAYAKQRQPSPPRVQHAPSMPPAAPPPTIRGANPDGRTWCQQCEQRVSRAVATSCSSPFCSLRKAA